MHKQRSHDGSSSPRALEVQANLQHRHHTFAVVHKLRVQHGYMY